MHTSHLAVKPPSDIDVKVYECYSCVGGVHYDTKNAIKISLVYTGRTVIPVYYLVLPF